MKECIALGDVVSQGEDGPFWKHLSLSLDVFVTLSLELHILGLFSCILDLFYLSS
jgi:hypothetical protein